jgi:hypothetical protein
MKKKKDKIAKMALQLHWAGFLVKINSKQAFYCLNDNILLPIWITQHKKGKYLYMIKYLFVFASIRAIAFVFKSVFKH